MLLPQEGARLGFLLALGTIAMKLLRVRLKEM